MAESESSQARLSAIRRRRRSGLLNHLIAYFAVMVVLVPVNLLATPGTVWFPFVMVAWGAPLAIHVAWAMELFGPPKV